MRYFYSKVWNKEIVYTFLITEYSRKMEFVLRRKLLDVGMLRVSKNYGGTSLTVAFFRGEKGEENGKGGIYD